LDNPVVTLASDPPLSHDDLLLLLLTGQPPKTVGGRSPREGASANIAVYLGRDFLDRWVQQRDADSKESVLNRLDVDVGRGVTQSGEETIDAQFRLARGVIWHNDTLYLVGEKDVFDNYNTGIKLVFRFK
jgi:translocation and assembly module TamB